MSFAYFLFAVFAVFSSLHRIISWRGRQCVSGSLFPVLSQQFFFLSLF